MKRRRGELTTCYGCGVRPGEMHLDGCDVERCALCGMNVGDLEESRPDIYKNGPTDAMLFKLDLEVEKFGGRLSWKGVWPGYEECIEFGRWCRRNQLGPGYVRCDRDHPDAGPDLNRLAVGAVWSREKRRFVLPGS